MSAEWTKFFSLRANRWILVALAVTPVGLAVLVALTGSLAPTDTVVTGVLSNAVVAQVVAGILGVLVIAGEYGSGTIRATLAARPHRPAVLAAKAALVLGLVLGTAGLSLVASVTTGAVLLSGRPVGPVWPAVLWLALGYAAVAVFGLAVGTVVRHPAGGIVVVGAVILVPALLAPMLGAAADWSPLVLMQDLAAGGDPGPALGVLWGGAALAQLVALRLFRIRDA